MVNTSSGTAIADRALRERIRLFRRYLLRWNPVCSNPVYVPEKRVHAMGKHDSHGSVENKCVKVTSEENSYYQAERFQCESEW